MAGTNGTFYWISRLALGSNGQVLTMSGGEPTWAANAAGFADPMTTRGDIIYRNSSNTTARLPVGTAGYVLTSDGTDVAWAASGSAPVTSVFSRTGAVTAATNDYTWAQIDKTTSDIADLTTKSHTSLTDIGTNNHAQIDTHIADSTIHFTEGSIDHGSISGLADDDHTQYHNDTRGDARYFQQTEFVNSTAGAGDAGKPIKLDASGVIDSSMYTDTNTTDHTALSNIGTNTHAQIDTHIANTSNPHSVPATQVGLGNVVNADTTTTANITDSADKRFITDAQQTVLGNTSGTNTGDQTFDDVSPMTTSGDIIYGGASGTGTRLAAGTNGHVLTLASGVPTWAAAGGGSSVYASAQYTDGTAGTSVNATTYTTIPMATADFEDTGYSNTSGVITVTDAGRYKIESFVSVTGTTSNYRWTGRMAVVKGASTVLKEIDGGYIRATSGANYTNISITHVVDLAASDTIKIQIKRISTTTGNATTTANNQLLITRLS